MDVMFVSEKTTLKGFTGLLCPKKEPVGSFLGLSKRKKNKVPAWVPHLVTHFVYHQHCNVDSRHGDESDK